MGEFLSVVVARDRVAVVACDDPDTSFFSAKAKVLAREKPMARERSKKRKPRTSARTISHYMYQYLSKKVGSSLVERERGGGTEDTCCRRVLEGGDRSQ